LAAGPTVVGEIIPDAEDVYRGLNPKFLDEGAPTMESFMISSSDPIDDGISFGRVRDISAENLLIALGKPSWGVAQINVAEALVEARATGCVIDFRQKDADDWGEHRAAHVMLTGYQSMKKKDRNDLRRYLAKLAARKIVIRASVN